ncbi:Pimeloyl-ACP methyl ester carboxylesterase [Sphingomonas guangdongensis]|uniref:Pimeloyl-ACP methyl ester carboxylesterase n=1 Tax=Sphingomonas guangdongensis TaxID=1141890 RepID=A0A285QC30_9SPHN|nr:alpha/beta hydrolase [Sphingomonas guangdongensis]SOB79490.1 Pimeloyl-ACP methyl ester carboxylesterase [Sphingomonas guangdongensis]
MPDGDDLPSLLGFFEGRQPPAPAWFTAALADAPARATFDADGAAIELLTWGERGRPGLLFLHGNAAHADWWSFIAPFFAATHRCAAISWSGMGGSAWRQSYSVAQFAAELLGATDAGDLAAAGPPIVVAHSFGGIPLIYTAAHHPERLGGGIMVDSFVPPPARKRPSWLVTGRAPGRYPTLAAALARYRFAPPQTSEHLYAVDHLARGSLHQVAADANGPAGWTWRFDPNLWATLDRTAADALVPQARVPIGLLHGAESALVGEDHVAHLSAQLPDCRFVAAVPGARHHIMVDQPLALVAALRVGISALSAPGRNMA